MNPGPTTSPDTALPPADVLRWCAAAPGLWFPSDHAAESGIPRDDLDAPVWKLQQAGLVQVADWVKGRGQGFTPTPAGREALDDPAKLAAFLDGGRGTAEGGVKTVPALRTPHSALRTSSLTRYDRGEMAREAVLGTPRMSVVAPTLLLMNLAWFGVGLVVAWQAGVSVEDYLRNSSVPVLAKTGAVDGPDLARGQWWRLLSACFVHIGLVHLLVNTVGLGTMGPTAENLWGRWRFAVIYLVSGVAGCCLAMAVRPNTILAGASGAIWGLITATLVWAVRYREFLPEDAARDWVRRLVGVLAVNAAISLIPGVSWEGHLGGGLAGAATAVGLDFARVGNGRRRWLGWGVVVLAAAAGPVGLAGAMRYAESWRLYRGLVDPRLMTEGLPRGVYRSWPDTVNAAGEDRVRAVHTAASVALVSQGSGAIASAREQVGELRAAVAAARAVVPADAEPVRVYLDAAAEYAAAADQLLAAGRPTTEDERKALAAKRTAVGQAWAKIAGRP